MAGGMSTSWLALVALSVLSSCSWMLVGGQTCSDTAADFASHTAVVNAEREDAHGSTPGVRVTWVIIEPECVASIRVEFRTGSRGSVVRSYTTTNTSEMEVIQTCLRSNTTYYIRVVVTGVSSLGSLSSNEVQVLTGVGELSSPTVTLRAEREDGSMPGIRVTWSTTAPPECVEFVRVEFRNSSRGSVVSSYNTIDTSQTEVIQTGLQCGTTYYIRVVVTGHGVSPLNSNEVQVPVGGSNGSVTFTGIAPGKYRLRVVVSDRGCNQSVLRRRVVIPEGPSYCTANLIDEGAVIKGSNVTFHFRGVGPVREFLCVMDRQTRVPCNSPVDFTGMEQGDHHFKVIPLGCGRRYTALPLKFNV